MWQVQQLIWSNWTFQVAQRRPCQFLADQSSSIKGICLAYQTGRVRFIANKMKPLSTFVPWKAAGPVAEWGVFYDFLGDFVFFKQRVSLVFVILYPWIVHSIHMDTNRLIASTGRQKLKIWSINSGEIILEKYGFNGVSQIWACKNTIWTRSFENELSQWDNDLTLLRKWLEHTIM